MSRENPWVTFTTNKVRFHLDQNVEVLDPTIIKYKIQLRIIHIIVSIIRYKKHPQRTLIYTHAKYNYSYDMYLT